ITSPPKAAWKKLVLSARSNRTMNWTPAMNGVAATTSSEVERFAHTSSGRRQKFIPGARIVMIVTRKLSAVATDDAPANWTPRLKNDCPNGAPVDSGAYPVHPASKAPPGTKKLAQNITPPIGSSQ